MSKLTQEQKDEFFFYMQELGFNPKSGNNNIHIYDEESDWRIDLCTTTARLSIKTASGLKTFTGVGLVRNQLAEFSRVIGESL